MKQFPPPNREKRKEDKKIRDFWKDIVYTKGKLSERKAMNELHDFYHCINEVPKVYEEITNGAMSKPNYYASDVLAEFHDNYMDKGITQDDVKDMIKRSKSLDELISELKDYFEI